LTWGNPGARRRAASGSACPLQDGEERSGRRRRRRDVEHSSRTWMLAVLDEGAVQQPERRAHRRSAGAARDQLDAAREQTPAPLRAIAPRCLVPRGAQARPPPRHPVRRETFVLGGAPAGKQSHPHPRPAAFLRSGEVRVLPFSAVGVVRLFAYDHGSYRFATVPVEGPGGGELSSPAGLAGATSVSSSSPWG